jgi:1-acyl-sn-glycerol-3-phosphate acyltransferase
VAAADYFLRTPFLAWFSLNVLGIIPIDRHKISKGEDPLREIKLALAKGETIILFPEGSRGEPEELAPLKGGVTHLLKEFPELPVIPIFCFGLGRALPRGEALLVPFFVDLFVGESLRWTGSKSEFMQELQLTFARLADEADIDRWEDGKSTSAD